MRILSTLVVVWALCGCANQAQSIRPQPTQLAGYWASSSGLYQEHWLIQPDGTGTSCSDPGQTPGQITSGNLQVAGDQISNGRATYAVTQITPTSFHAKQENGPGDFSFTRETQATGGCTSVLSGKPNTRGHV